MKHQKWIWIGMTLFVIALTAAVLGINAWYNSGNVRVLGGQIRVELSGVGYIFSHEDGELEGQTTICIEGESLESDKQAFDGWMNVAEYINEVDGTVTTNQGVLEGDDGYWEIHKSETCRHVEEDDEGNSEVVNHSCKYSYIFYVHPDKQDFLVVRVRDKYAVYPWYVVMADSEEEATRIYQEFTADRN